MKANRILEKLLNGAEVELYKIGDIAELKRGKTITAKSVTNGNIPVISGGKKPAYYTGEYNRNGETITIAGSGAYAGFVMYWNEPIFVSDAFSIKPCNNIVVTKYIYYFLLHQQKTIFNMKKGSGVPHVYPKDLSVLEIPIPPLSVQKEIVKRLDILTELEATLEAELSLRKKQYEYYRNLLLTFDDISDRGGYNHLFPTANVVWKSLGEVGQLIRGNGLQKKDFTEVGVPAIHYGQIYTYYGVSTFETISFVSEELAIKLRKVNTGDVVITNTSENLEDVGKALVYLGKKQAVTGGHSTIFKPSKDILGKYFVYFTQTIFFYNEKRKYAKGTKVIDVSATDMAKILIPIPPLETQAKIVEILDKFDTLTDSISEGLPKEIELRKKQYEHYREMLLSFPKA